jgi:ATP-binding cassette, subfamily C, bacteriocin exporter
MLKKHKFVRQMDTTDCGPACLAVVFQFYGLKIPLSKLREISKTNRNGTTIFGMLTAIEQFGFIGKVVKVKNFEQIKGDFPKPAITYITLSNGMNHYVVIQEVKKNKIIVADPGQGIVRYSFEQFFKMWTGVLICMIYKTDANKKIIKVDKSGYLSCLRLFLKQKKISVVITIGSMLITTLGIGSALFYMSLIDRVAQNSNVYLLSFYARLTILLLVLKVTFEYLRSLLSEYLTIKIEQELLLGYYKHVINLPMDVFSSMKVGEIISRFQNGYVVRDALSSVVITVLIDVIISVFGAFYLYSISNELFFFNFITIIIYLVFKLIVVNKLDGINNKMKSDSADLVSYSVDTINNIETVKAFTSEKTVEGITDDKYYKSQRNSLKSSIINHTHSKIMYLIKTLIAILSLWYGAFLLINKELSIKGFIEFYSLLVYFLIPIERVFDLQSQLQQIMTEAKRLSEIFEFHGENDNIKNKKITSLYGDITINHISFRYGGQKLLLEDLSLKINAGERVGFVGRSGSGKTTLSKLLLRFYEIENGSIYINGCNIEDINAIELRKHISYISQEISLFHGTIKENLTMWDEKINLQDIENVCREIGLDRYIDSLPYKYNTIVTEQGKGLSGGEKQKIAIARALLKKSDILIMDESTSNLDPITENEIKNAIDKYMGRITTIIISHRLSTIKNCDKIYVFDKGRIMEEGSHDELISANGYYYKLWIEQNFPS